MPGGYFDTSASHVHSVKGLNGGDTFPCTRTTPRSSNTAAGSGAGASAIAAAAHRAVARRGRFSTVDVLTTPFLGASCTWRMAVAAGRGHQGRGGGRPARQAYRMWALPKCGSIPNPACLQAPRRVLQQQPSPRTQLYWYAHLAGLSAVAPAQLHNCSGFVRSAGSCTPPQCKSQLPAAAISRSRCALQTALQVFCLF